MTTPDDTPETPDDAPPADHTAATDTPADTGSKITIYDLFSRLTALRGDTDADDASAAAQPSREPSAASWTRFRTITGWLAGGGFVLIGLAFTLVAPLTGVLFVVAGAFITPRGHAAAEEAFDRQFPTGATLGIAIALIVAGGAAVPNDVESEADTPNAAENAADNADAATTANSNSDSNSDGGAAADANNNADADNDADGDAGVNENEAADEARADKSAMEAADTAEQLLSSQGHPSTSVEVSSIGDDLIVSYQSDADTQGQLAAEIGTFAAVYASLVEEGYAVGDMVVVVDDAATGDTAGRFSVMKDWARDYNNGIISQEEFAYRILNTVSPADNRAPIAAVAHIPAVAGTAQ